MALARLRLRRAAGARRGGPLADEHGVEPTVADARFAKPLDGELIERLARRARPARDGRGERAGRRLRLGGARAPRRPRPAGRDTRVLRFGLPDRYVTHGKPALLREEVGLTPEAVAERVAQAVLEPTGALA